MRHEKRASRSITPARFIAIVSSGPLQKPALANRPFGRDHLLAAFNGRGDGVRWGIVLIVEMASASKSTLTLISAKLIGH